MTRDSTARSRLLWRCNLLGLLPPPHRAWEAFPIASQKEALNFWPSCATIWSGPLNLAAFPAIKSIVCDDFCDSVVLVLLQLALDG